MCDQWDAKLPSQVTSNVGLSQIEKQPFDTTKLLMTTNVFPIVSQLYRILSQCPNLEYLDVSQTIISDLGLNG